jgi:hypothetical protein
MYRQLIIIGILLLIIHTSSAQCVDTAKLNAAYRAYVADPTSVKCQMNFFRNFPSTWSEYYATYMDFKAYEVMYGKLGDEQNNAFENLLGVIPDSIYYVKMINIAAGGYWDADHINKYQDFLHRVAKSHTKVLVEQLKKQTKGFQLRFWQFFWSTLPDANYRKDEYLALRKQLYGISQSVTKIMDIAFEYSGKESCYSYSILEHPL